MDDLSELDFSAAELDALADEAGTPVIRFRAGERVFAFLAETVSEVRAGMTLMSVPGLPEHVLGTFISRGKVCAYLDPFRVASGGATYLSLIVDDGDWRVGLAVDLVDGIETIDLEQAQEAPPGPFNELTLASIWVPGGVLTVIDVKKLLERLAVNPHAQSDRKNS